MIVQTRMVEVRQNVLRQNDVVARELRQRFRDARRIIHPLTDLAGTIVD
jgi:hypothetical protein